MEHNLNLDAAQQKKVGALLEEAGGKIKEVRRQTQPQVSEILEDYRGKIRQELNPDQQKKFDDMMTNYNAHRQQFQ